MENAMGMSHAIDVIRTGLHGKFELAGSDACSELCLMLFLLGVASNKSSFESSISKMSLSKDSGVAGTIALTLSLLANS